MTVASSVSCEPVTEANAAPSADTDNANDAPAGQPSVTTVTLYRAFLMPGANRNCADPTATSNLSALSSQSNNGSHDSPSYSVRTRHVRKSDISGRSRRSRRDLINRALRQVISEHPAPVTMKNQDHHRSSPPGAPCPTPSPSPGLIGPAFPTGRPAGNTDAPHPS